jgi:inner membrane protein
MMARSHVVVGAASWIAAAPWLHLNPLEPASLGLAVAGSLLPDVDHPQSWVGRRMRPLSTIVASALGHRGLTHSALAVFGLVALLAHTGYRWGWISAFAVGYLSHLAADMLTPRGLRLAWPLQKTWAWPLCRTGSPMEPFIVLALTCWIVFRVFSSHSGSIHRFGAMHWLG